MQDGTYVIDVKGGQIASQPIPVGSYMGEHGGIQLPNQYLIGGGIFFFVFFLFLTVFIVKQQSVKIIERLGKFKTVATAGFNWKIPLFDKIVGELDLRIQQLEENITAKTNDNAFVTVPIKVQYRVMADKAKEAFYTLQDADKQMKAYITNIVRSTATSLSMEGVFQNKTTIESEVTEGLNEKFSGFGYEIVNVLVDNPLPSDEVVESFNKVIASQRLKEAAINEAEAIRVKTVAVAKAEGESLTIKATAYVEQKRIMVEGIEGFTPELRDYLIGIDTRDTIRVAAEKGQLIIATTQDMADGIGRVIAGVRNK